MNPSTTQPMNAETRRKILVWIRGAFLGLLGYAAIVLISAGRWDWLWGWIYIGLTAVVLASHVFVLVPVNPALLAGRSEGLAGTRWWDRGLVLLMGICLLAIMIVAGLDARFGWSGEVALGVHLAGILIFSAGWALFLWAMASNPFFSESVRIQPGHQVAVSGPYRFIRHPGYAGACIYFLAQPLVFGSWWAFIPALLAVACYILRTSLEDRTLQNELPGYLDYAGLVRYRLMPYIW
jgi:protein-S-isoprenylcysteine O-methyltransferase Ste14